MIAELDHLADRVDQLARMARALREENHSLRAGMAENHSETSSLHVRLDAARMRIERLLAALPSDGAG